MHDTFRVIFEGEIESGREKSEVLEQITRLYKGNNEAASRLFSKKPALIKGNIDYQTALKYKTAFEKKTGAKVRIIKDTVAEAKPVLGSQPGPKENVGQGPAKPAENEVGSPPAMAATPPAKSGGNLLNGIALVIMVLIFGTVGLRFWSSHTLDNFVAIDHVAANKDTVVIHAGGTLYFQTHDGQSKQVVDLAAFGLAEPPADVELLDDGSILIGDMETNTILRCDVQTQTCTHFAPTNDFSTRDNFKFLVDEPRGLLFIADTNNDRLLVQNLKDATCFAADATSKLNYPNDMAIDGKGILYLCDTNRFRILSFKVDTDSVYEIGKPITIIPDFLTKADSLLDSAKDPQQLQAEMKKIMADIGEASEEASHAKPFSLALGPEKNLWATMINTVMTSGAVRGFDSEGEITEKIDLEDGAVPVDIIRLNDNFLVVDSGLIQAYTINPLSHYVQEFGDETFQKDMRKLFKHRSYFQVIKGSALKVTLLLGLAALVVLFIAKRQGVA